MFTIWFLVWVKNCICPQYEILPKCMSDRRNSPILVEKLLLALVIRHDYVHLWEIWLRLESLKWDRFLVGVLTVDYVVDITLVIFPILEVSLWHFELMERLSYIDTILGWHVLDDLVPLIALRVRENVCSLLTLSCRDFLLLTLIISDMNF